jgi:phosphoribosylformylglycinamidine (FGAM) synthase-like enzyme
VMGHYNICSKEWVIRQYDHEVQGGSVIKPLSGVNADGPSDASVVAPKFGSTKGIAVSNGINFLYGMQDPYWMAANCIDEAIRQIISVGGNLKRIAILDNFCWGNPDKPDRLGSLVRCAQGCYDAAVAFGTPFISGKDSLYNEYTEGKKSIAIPGTLLISALGIIDDVRRCVTMDFKEAGNRIYVVGVTDDELGGSIYLENIGQHAGVVPRVHFPKANKLFTAMSQAVQAGAVRAAHDCSDGGLAAALSEMAFSGQLGLSVRLDMLPKTQAVSRDDTALFSESASRFVVEVEPKHQKDFEKMMKGLPVACIGTVESSPEFVVYGLKKDPVIQLNIAEIKEAWQKPLRF